MFFWTNFFMKNYFHFLISNWNIVSILNQFQSFFPSDNSLFQSKKKSCLQQILNANIYLFFLHKWLMQHCIFWHHCVKIKANTTLHRFVVWNITELEPQRTRFMQIERNVWVLLPELLSLSPVNQFSTLLLFFVNLSQINPSKRYWWLNISLCTRDRMKFKLKRL